MAHDCIQEENIGKFKEFMESTKGLKATIFTISLAILIQVGAFLVLWGGLTTTVKNHDKNIDRILAKLDNAKVVYALTDKVINGKQ